MSPPPLPTDTHRRRPCEQGSPMKLPPLWKITRELKRPFQQVPALPSQLGTLFFGAKYYDLFLSRRIRTSAGQMPRGDQVAIYLIYPQDGILESHWLALEYLRDNGYAPLVVSNLPLAERDLAELRGRCWRILERPNVGYDFGGYRDGFLSLEGEHDSLKRLVFLNDSSWFPLPGAGNWLREAEALGVDYAAAATSMGIVRVKPDQFEEIQWKFDPSLRNFHYGSYALSVGPRLLQDPGYRRYWRRYPLTKKKNRVVRRGEIGMTRFVLKHGFSHGASYDIRSLPEVLEACSGAQINAYARSMNYLDDAASQELMDRVLPGLDAAASASDRDRMTRLILATVARIGPSYVLPQLLYEQNGFAFLKKSLVSVDKENSARVAAFAQKLEGSAGQIIRDEIAMIRQRKGY